VQEYSQPCMATDDAHEMHILNTEDVRVYIYIYILCQTFYLNDLLYISYDLSLSLFPPLFANPPIEILGNTRKIKNIVLL